MTIPIKLLIQRKTKVPTKAQNVHLWRSDWKKVYMIGYEESRSFFRSIGSHGVFESDGQFCNWLKSQFGEGIYSIIAWRKGYKGFWGFLKVELLEDRFRRLKRIPTPQDIELKNEKQNLENLKRKQKNKDDDIEETEADIETSQEIIKDAQEDIKNKKSGCYPYLKSLQPVYSWHSYEDYGKEDKKEEFRFNGL